VLKPAGTATQQQQQQLAAADGAGEIAASRPQQQQQQRQVSIHADATQQAAERSGGLASTSGRPTDGSSTGADWLPAVRTRLEGMSLQHSGGSASVPLEAASPLRGGQGSQQAAAAAAAVLAASAQQEQQQQLTADDYHARGYALRKQGDFAGAVREYSRALALDPGHFKCLFNRAFSLDKVGVA
jgi:tetratricopeptide (TPR) repeat protein